MTANETTPRINHNIGQDFILAGKAIFTMVGTSARFTYKVTRKDPEVGSRYTQPTYFVALLTGSNNETDYSYLGILDPVTGYVRLTRNSRMGADAPAVKAIQWALPKIWARATMPAAFAIMHEGRCGRCGRTLTVPESIASGIGPDCAGKMGGAFVAPVLPVESAPAPKPAARPATRPSLMALAAQVNEATGWGAELPTA